MPHLEARTPYSDDHAACRGWRDAGAISARPRTISRTTATPDAMPHSVLPTVFGLCTPRFGGKRRLPRPHSCASPLLVTIKGGGGLPLDSLALSLSLSEDAQTLLGLSYCGHLCSQSSPYPAPLLAETWEFPSLSCLACTPYYKHIGCKIIQCPRTPPLLDVRPRGRNQDKRVLCCLLHHHLGRGNTQHLLVGIQAPGSGHRQLARQVGGAA